MSIVPFTIPSIHDNTQLECRLHVPQSLFQGNSCVTWGAIVAHPYAPLGGSLDDHVVSIVAKELLSQGILTLTFNFRGAGNSRGRTSWTGAAEDEDYLSAVYFLIALLEDLAGDDAGRSSREVHVILGGYSYGSMKAMNTSLASDFLNTTSWTQPKSDIQAIKQAALKVAVTSSVHTQDSKNRKVIGTGASAPQHESQGSERGKGSRDRILMPHYLLISPLLPPISFLLNLSNPFKSFHKKSTYLEEQPTLVVYGSHDGFTSAKKVTEWCRNISQQSSSSIQYLEVQDADHFWRSDLAQKALRNAIRDWTIVQLSNEAD